MNKRILIAERPFEFSPRVTLQLGRESVSSSTVAISELIKNSYDADANNVTLTFHLREYGTSTLVIEDDGIGMDHDTIFNHWLRIGTDNKSVGERSVGKQRILTGAKGLGRLGIDRLCKRLILYSKSSEMSSAVQLNVDWKKFENSDKSLSEIKNEVYEVELPISDKYGSVFAEKSSSGTRMILLGLKDRWNSDFISVLENELRLLTSPFHGDNQFSINLRVRTGNSLVERSVTSEVILSAARWKVQATVDVDGNVSVVYINNQKQMQIMHDPLAWNQWIKNSGIKPLFGPLTFEFYYLAQDTENLSKLNLKVKNYREFMRLNQGVRLYRDNFRVRPYGEPSGKGDWLDLGLRKAGSPGGLSQVGWKIGPNQIVGAVTISRETNAILNDQANREGIVENSAFYQLRTFLIKVIDTFEVLVQKDAGSEKEVDLSNELAKILSKSNEDLGSAIEELKKTVSVSRKTKPGKKNPPSIKDVIKRRLDELTRLQKRQGEVEQQYLEALKQEKSELQEQKNTLSNLASIGILTISFGHEVRQHSAFALNGSLTALKFLSQEDNPSLYVSKAVKSVEIAKSGAEYVDNFSRFAIENIRPDKRTRKKVNVKSVFLHVFDMFAATLDKMKINRDISSDDEEKTYEVFAFEIDWESIVLNFLTNSIWAIENSPNREDSRVQVEINETADNLVVSYRDSGVGLETGTEQSIFLPMNSGKRDLRGNVIGTGMGLAIVKSHVESHMGGAVTAKSHGVLGGAEFTITVPIRGKR